MNLPAKWNHDDAQFFPEKRLLHLDISKAKDHLDWHPRMGTGEALAMTAEWYLDWMQNADMKRTTLRQIEAYEALVFASVRGIRVVNSPIGDKTGLSPTPSIAHFSDPKAHSA